MAIVILGGLLTSTVLSLLVVPVLFELVDEAKIRMRRIVREGRKIWSCRSGELSH